MIDLHLHLDGSLSPSLVLELAKEQKLELPEGGGTVQRLLEAPEDCESLNDYLRCFELPLQLLQTEEALFRAAWELGDRLAKQGLLYGEIRFAPQLHTRNRVSQRQAVEAVWKGLRAAMKENPRFSAQIILCCMRGGGDKENRETVETAARYLGEGVCAVDLAGAEALYPTRDHRELFSYAKTLEIPFTIHAGEADGSQSVWDALSFGAARIGHGVRAIEDPELVQEIIRRKIPLELCFTSNLQTKAVPSAEKFPLGEFLKNGVKATVNTDNMTVSGVTLLGEFKKLRALGLTWEQERELLQNSVEAAFLPEEKKEALRQAVLREEEEWQKKEEPAP